MYNLSKSKAVTVVSLISLGAGVVVIIGWAFNLPGIASLFPKLDSMKFNTALCFSCLGSALLVTQYKNKSYSKTVYLSLAALLTAYGALSLSQDIFGYNAGIDQLFVTDNAAIAEKYAFPGRMAANVSACFVLFGLALFGFSSKNRAVNSTAQYLLHIVTAISSLALLGYLWGLSLYYNLSYIAAMSLQSAVVLFVTSITATLLHPSLGITNLFTGNLIGNKMARRVFVMMVLMIVIFGSLRLQTQHWHIFSLDLGVSLLALTCIAASLLIIWDTAKWLNKMDAKRYEAEEEITVMNEELEERVNERSAELLVLLEKFMDSESKFRTAFEYSAIGMALVSLEGKWLQVNNSLCDILGYSEAELLTMTFMDVTHPHDLQASIETMTKGRMLQHDSHHLEKRYVKKNGAIVWANVNMAVVFDDNGEARYLVSQVEDITDRKKIDARFRTIVESVFIGIKLNDADGNIIYRSPSMQAINGWTDEEMNRNYFKLTHPDDLERIKNTHTEVLLNPGKSINIIYRILHKNGNYIWIESMLCNKLSDPELGAIITVTRDITERIIAEDQLKNSEEKYHSLIEHASDAIYLLDFDGNFIDVNHSMCKMTGYLREELLLLNIEALVDPEQLKTDPLVHGPREADQATIRERRLIRKDGTIFDVEINVKRFAGDKILVIARDITDRKRMEEELREAELKFRTMAEKSMVGVYISQQERFTYVNPRFAAIFGYEPHELINTPGSAIDIIISKEEQEKVRDTISARYRGEADNAHYEVAGKRKDGTMNHVEFFGNRVILDGKPSIIGTMLDITGRKQAQELILREKILSETIINSLPEVFYLRNDKGQFLRWNKNLEKVTGYTSEEITQLTSTGILAVEDLHLVKKARENRLETGHATLEARVIRKDGAKVPFLITVTSIVYENQPCVLGIAIDISSRKKDEEILRSSEQKYKLLFESNPLPLTMIAKDDLSIIAVNQASADLYGYTRDELLKMNARVFRPKKDLEQQLEIFQRDISDSSDLGVIRNVRKDGTIIFVHIIAHDIVFEGRSVRLSLATDVTEKLKAEEKLQKSEANLKTIMNTTDTAYALLDKKLNVMAFNQMAVKFVNSQFNHFPAKGDQLADYFPSERFPQFINYADEVLKGRSISYEISYPQPDDSICWYYVRLFPITNDKNEIFGMMLALSDISERKNAEESLKVAYKLVQDHIDSIKEMAWKQSHFLRSPLANLKGLFAMLEADPSDHEVHRFINTELERMDTVIIEMAEDASNHAQL